MNNAEYKRSQRMKQHYEVKEKSLATWVWLTSMLRNFYWKWYKLTTIEIDWDRNAISFSGNKAPAIASKHVALFCFIPLFRVLFRANVCGFPVTMLPNRSILVPKKQIDSTAAPPTVEGRCANAAVAKKIFSRSLISHA